MIHENSSAALTLAVRSLCFATLCIGLTCLQFGSVADSCQAALVAHWDFDGNLLDDSGNANHLSVGTGSAAYSGTTPAAYSTQSALFDGATRLDQTTPTNFGFTSYTVAGWIKAPLPDSSGYHGIFWRGPVGATDIEIYTQLNSNDLVVAHNRSNGGTFGYAGFADPVDDTYYHLAVTYDGTTVTAYYDGVSQPIVAQDNLLPVPQVTLGHQVSVGKMNHLLFNPNFLDGLVDEMFVYDRALNLEEINNLITYNSITVPPVPEPSSVVLIGLAVLLTRFRRIRRGK